jgi:hypothetical protein
MAWELAGCKHLQTKYVQLSDLFECLLILYEESERSPTETFQSSLPVAEYLLRSVATCVQCSILIRLDTILPAVAGMDWCGSAASRR